MKKWFKVATTSMLASTILLTGCGEKSSTTNSSSNTEGTKKDEKTTLTAWAWNVNVGALNDAMTLYQKDNPDVEIKVEDIGRLDVYDKLSTGLAAGGIGLPDIVLVEDDRIGGYLQAFEKGFSNLSDLGFDQSKDLFPKFKQELTSKDGSFYAFPFDAGPTGLFYRRDIFDKAGVKAEDIETWDDLLTAGKTIKEKTGSFTVPADKFKDDAAFRMMLNQLGVYYFNSDEKVDLTNPKVIQAMEMLKSFDKAGLIKNVDGWNGTVAATVDGSVATVPFGAWYYGTIIDQAKDSKGNWGVIQLPAFEKGGNRAANLGGSSWMIPSSSKNQQAAYDFLTYFSTNADVQLMAMEKHGLFPSLSSVYEKPLFSSNIEFFGNQPIWKLFADEMKDIPTPYYTSNYAIAFDEAVKAQAAVFNGTDVTKALEDASKNIESRIKK